MSERATTIAVDADDALDDVIGRLRGAAGGTVLLTIPPDSALFLTANEFRALKEVADRGRLALSVRTDDPLRLQLARLLGVEVAPAERRPPAVTPPSPKSLGTPRSSPRPANPALTLTPRPRLTIPVPSAPAPGGANPAAEPGNGPRPAPMSAGTPAPVVQPPPPTPSPSAPLIPAAPSAMAPLVAATPASAPNGEDSVSIDPLTGWPEPPLADLSPLGVPPRTTKPRPRVHLAVARGLTARWRSASAVPAVERPEGGERPRAAAAGDDSVQAVDGAVVPIPRPTGDQTPRNESSVGDWRQVRAQMRQTPRGLATVTVGSVLLLALLGTAIFVSLPRAEVTVILAERALTTELLFDVVPVGEPPPADAALVTTARPVRIEAEFTGSVPTTGVRREPDQPAVGAISFRNPDKEKATIAAGTTFATELGVEFALVDELTVPAAADSAGEALGQVRAVEPGTRGNVPEPGALSGRLPNGVYYMSRDGPLGGGTDREIAVVAEADLDLLRAQAEAAWPALAGERLAARDEDGLALLPSSVRVGEGREVFDHAVGEPADQVSLRVVRPVTALAFDPLAPRTAAIKELAQRLAAEAPAGFVLDPASVRVLPPVVIEERQGGARFRLEARGAARAAFGEADRARLAEALAGRDRTAAAAMLAGDPVIAGFEVAYRPAWLAGGMPSSPGRIEIVVENGPVAIPASSPGVTP